MLHRLRHRLINGSGRQARRALSRLGEITATEAQALSVIVRDLASPGPIIEIGTLFGWSTLIMAAAKERDRELITVDNYCWNPLGLSPEAHRSVTRARLSDASKHLRVKVLDRDKAEFFATYSGPAPAMVFLDADHAYAETLKDIDWALSVNAGVVCGHDYCRVQFAGTARAVDERGGLSSLTQSLWTLKREGSLSARQ